MNILKVIKYSLHSKISFKINVKPATLILGRREYHIYYPMKVYTDVDVPTPCSWMYFTILESVCVCARARACVYVLCTLKNTFGYLYIELLGLEEIPVHCHSVPNKIYF